MFGVKLKTLASNCIWPALLFLPIVVFCQENIPALLQGRVVGITDGDTVTLLVDRKQYKIRLAEIDTPERGQPYGSRARQVLSELVFGKDITAKVEDVDRYGRYVARLYQGDIDVNREMVRQGAAWVYRQYATDESLYQVEEEARAAGRGLWSLPEAQRAPPWEWRANGRSSSPRPAETTPAVQGQSFSCGPKRYCREMTSCQEAQFYLRSCGLSRLDGDFDGLACETLCR